MQGPIQIHFEHLDPSEFIEGKIREEAEKLEQIYDHITSMRVVVARPQHRHHKGDTYQVRIHVTVPGAADIAVTRDPGDRNAHDDAYVTIRDAFEAAKRQLRDLSRQREGHAKAHDAQKS